MVLNETGKDSIVIRRVDSQTFLNFVQINAAIINKKTPSHHTPQSRAVTEKVRRIIEQHNLKEFMNKFNANKVFSLYFGS